MQVVALWVAVPQSVVSELNDLVTRRQTGLRCIGRPTGAILLIAAAVCLSRASAFSRSDAIDYSLDGSGVSPDSTAREL